MSGPYKVAGDRLDLVCISSVSSGPWAQFSRKVGRYLCDPLGKRCGGGQIIAKNYHQLMHNNWVDEMGWVGGRNNLF